MAWGRQRLRAGASDLLQNHHGNLACLHCALLYARIQRQARGYQESDLWTVWHRFCQASSRTWDDSQLNQMSGYVRMQCAAPGVERR